jgi:hypothetical protein
MKTVMNIIYSALAVFALLPTVQAAPSQTNTTLGKDALKSNTTGVNDTALGYQALTTNPTGHDNTAVGYQALYSNTSQSVEGGSNTAVGSQALFTNTTGWGNTAIGNQALYSNTGTRNTATGDFALGSNTTGDRNIATGYGALGGNTTGGRNVAYGNAALGLTTTGNYNTALGYSAGYVLTAGNNNIIINNVGVASDSNTIRLGSQVAGVAADGSTQAAHTATFIAGIYGATTSDAGSTIPVYVDLNGNLGTVASSKRFKTGIKPIDKSSEALLALKPVTFHYKNDSKGIPQFGLVAEDVEKINPDLVVHDDQGKPYTVRYEAVNAMLLNEFLKEHRKVEQRTKDFESKLAEQQKQIEALTAGLQKVSAQVEMSGPAPQLVENRQ